MEKKKRNIVIGMTSLLLATLLLLGLTYAYYKTRIAGNSNEKSVSVVSKNLSVKYQNESAEISATGIEPGYSATKTFEVKNTGSETVEYSVMLDNVTNTFARTEDWTYTISEGGTTLKSGTLPYSTSYILYSEGIDAGATKIYTLKIDYANSAEDQSDDMASTLSLRINIDNATASTLTSAGEGTLLYAIGRDNVISEPLTVPGQQTSKITLYEESGFGYTHYDNDPNFTESKYAVYGTGYTFDKKTGLYSLTGVTVTSKPINESYDELNGKYLAYNSNSITGATKEEAQKQNTTNLSQIFKFNTISHTLTVNNSIISIASSEFAATEDDYGTSYYYRGDVQNNYVTYSNMCWRVVRVQGDGTIKLVLADEDHPCGTANGYSTDNSGAFINDGQKYYYRSSTTETVEDYVFETSNVPNLLSTWSTEKSLDTSKLVDNEWCNDTAKTSEIIDDRTEEFGLIFTYSHYGAYDRLENLSTASPTLKCNTKGMEGTSGKEANAQKYTGKIALLTPDEVAFAGATTSSTLIHQFYLNSNNNTMLMPYGIISSSNTAMPITYHYLGDSYDDAIISRPMMGYSSSIRPAIVLNANVTISSGNGTIDNPYVIN